MYLRGNNCRRQLSPLTKAGGKRPRWKLLKGRSSEEGPKEVPLRSLEGGCSGAAGVDAVRLAGPAVVRKPAGCIKLLLSCWEELVGRSDPGTPSTQKAMEAKAEQALPSPPASALPLAPPIDRVQWESASKE